MNFSAISVIAGRTVVTSLMSPGPPFRLDTMENVASRISRDCSATITCDESANLVKDHETWDASNLAPRTQVVLALPALERAFNLDLCIICLFLGWERVEHTSTRTTERDT